jgi:agmatinase
MNFGGLGPEHSGAETSRFVVVPVPYDLTSTYQTGARHGPSAILDASANMELYDEELQKETYRSGIYTMEALTIDARGPQHMIRAVNRVTKKIIDAGKISILLGGEHSISFGAVQAAKKKYPDLSVIQFDAHADLRDEYQGSPFSHASVARRIVELCPLVQVGIRSMSAEEAAFYKKSNIRSYSAEDVHGNKNIDKEICKHLKGDIYVTVDLDVLDPSIMPSTGTPEPDGLSWRQLLCILKAVSRRCKVLGVDVVELSPIPGMVAPDFLAAKLIYRIMGYLSE